MKDSTSAILYVAAGATILFLGSRVIAALRPDIPPDARRVACLGDSLTASGIYCKHLKQFLPEGSVTKAWGYEGKGTGYILNHMNAAMAWKPTDLVVLAGVNDLPGSHGSSSTVIRNLEKIYAKAHNLGVRVVAVQLTPWLCCPSANDPGTFAVNAWIENDSTADAVVSTRALGDAGYCLMPQFDSGDGLHLNKDGQHLLGELIADQAFNW